MNVSQIKNRFRLSKSRVIIDQDIVLFIITRLFFLLFIYSAADKLYDIEKFRVQLGQSPLLTNFAGLVAWLIPAIEIIISILLIIPKTKLLGLYASFSLMVMFTAYIFVIMNYSEYIPCSCNGILEGATWGQHLTFNTVFVFLAVGGIFMHIHGGNKPAKNIL